MKEEKFQAELWSSQKQNMTSNGEAQAKTAKKQKEDVESSAEPIVPTSEQVERLRLILSTYQDGTGMLSPKPKKSGKRKKLTDNIETVEDRNLPGWRDFERAVAAAFDGKVQESKHVFDVIVPSKDNEESYGISCKMLGELSKSIDKTNRAGRFQKGRVSTEMANAAKSFWSRIKARGIDESTFRENPTESGIALVDLVTTWHNAASLEGINLSKSFYLVLEWDGVGKAYQLFQYSLQLPDPRNLKWHFPFVTGKGGEQKQALRLSGDDEFGTIFDWYSGSGGQLKYYPLTEDALWYSEKFQLEPLPKSEDLKYGILAKAKAYFPDKWMDNTATM